MLPAFSNHTNTYTSSLAKALQKQGHVVEEFSWKLAWKGGYDIIHAHWVDHAVGQQFPKGFLWAVAFLSTCRIAKNRKAKIFLTLHNLQSHEHRNPKLHRWFRFRLHKLLNGGFSLSQDATKEALEIYPEIKSIPITVVPHPHYRDDYPNAITKPEARQKLKIAEDATVFAFVGQIRPYKGTEDLLAAWPVANIDNSILLIAGQPGQSDVNRLQELADHPSIKTRFEFIPDEDLQNYMKAADLVVLPFTRVLNSGSALLALSFDRPLLAPRLGSLPELQREVGEQWMHLYEPGPILAQTLKEAALWLKERTETKCNQVNKFTFEFAAEITLKAYRQS